MNEISVQLQIPFVCADRFHYFKIIYCKRGIFLITTNQWLIEAQDLILLRLRILTS